MNSQELKEEIAIDKLLANEGYKPVKSQHSGNTLWYLSPLVTEKTPSFKIDIKKGLWYDFSQAVGGDIFDFIIKTKGVNFREAFNYLNNQYDKINQISVSLTSLPHSKFSNVKIISSKELENKFLLQYIESRKINIALAKKYCKEVYYQLTSDDKPVNKLLYAIGFVNEKNGFELRNKYFKGNGRVKAISYIDNKSKISCVFEGFFDFLSYVTEFPQNELKHNHIILNTNSFVKKLTQTTELLDNSLYQKMIQAEKLLLHFDNDSSGDESKKIIQSLHSNCIDNSFLYKNFTDYNAKLIG